MVCLLLPIENQSVHKKTENLKNLKNKKHQKYFSLPDGFGKTHKNKRISSMHRTQSQATSSLLVLSASTNPRRTVHHPHHTQQL